MWYSQWPSANQPVAAVWSSDAALNTHQSLSCWQGRWNHLHFIWALWLRSSGDYKLLYCLHHSFFFSQHRPHLSAKHSRSSLSFSSPVSRHCQSLLFPPSLFQTSLSLSYFLASPVSLLHSFFHLSCLLPLLPALLPTLASSLLLFFLLRLSSSSSIWSRTTNLHHTCMSLGSAVCVCARTCMSVSHSGKNEPLGNRHKPLANFQISLFQLSKYCP